MNTRQKLSWTLLGVALFFGIAAVSTDTSFFKNASLTGWLSLSGATNRLTVADGALTYDGASSSSSHVSVKNDGASYFVIKDTSTSSGLQIDDNATLPGTNSFQVSLFGSKTDGGAFLDLNASDDNYSDIETYAKLSTSGDNSGSLMSLYGTADGYTTEYLMSLAVNPASGQTVATFSKSGVPGVTLDPGASSGGQAHVLGTYGSFSSGDILALQNNGTNKVQFKSNGSITTGGNTNQWSFGGKVTEATVTLTTTNYLEITLNGVVHKVALVQ